MTEQEIVLRRRVVKQGDKWRRILTCLDGRYSLWEDGLRWRWALREWPDDGSGISTHGARATLEEAVAACIENQKILDDEKEIQQQLRTPPGP